jgi:hypothetical protein
MPLPCYCNNRLLLYRPEPLLPRNSPSGADMFPYRPLITPRSGAVPISIRSSAEIESKYYNTKEKEPFQYVYIDLSTKVFGLIFLTSDKAHKMEKFDIVLLGATGYTGRLCAAYMAQVLPETTSWAIAGRSRVKLAQLYEDLELQRKTCMSFLEVNP